jgi:alkanesulfonate monooxygenase SsuD/methylene tetrahydromethanopterin reductase-like flavin-dependent oxidoreductase (luciferase family)
MEKLDLVLKLNAGERVTWSGGRFRAALDDAEIAPRPLHDRLPVWVGVGGTPQSVVRAATLGLPMILGIIGGLPYSKVAQTIELLATEVAPVVRRETARQPRVHSN